MFSSRLESQRGKQPIEEDLGAMWAGDRGMAREGRQAAAGGSDSFGVYSGNIQVKEGCTFFKRRLSPKHESS